MRLYKVFETKIRQKGLAPLWLFLVLSISCGSFFLLKVPFMWSADGGAHVARAYQVADGQWKAVYMGHEHGMGYGGYIPQNLDTLRHYQLSIVGQLGEPGHERQTKDISKEQLWHMHQLAAEPASKKKVLISFVNTAAYSPVAYAPAALGIKVGESLGYSIGTSIYLGRLAGFLVFVMALSYALYTLRKSRIKWTLMAVALTPLVVFQTALITADSMLFTTMLLFCALTIKLFLPGQVLTRADRIVLAVTAVFLPLVKTVYFPFVALLLIAPRTRWKSRRSFMWFTGGVIVLSFLGFALWSYATRDVAASNGLVRGDTLWHYGDAARQAKFLLYHPLSFLYTIAASLVYKSGFYINTTFSWLGFNYLPIPGVAQLAVFFALGLGVVLIEPMPVKVRKYGYSLLLFSLGVTLLIFATLYIAFTLVANPVVEGVQGRYILPFFPLISVGLAFVWGKLRIAKGGLYPAVMALIVLVTFGLIISTIRYGLAVVA